jgi:signal transduction histidine kinase
VRYHWRVADELAELKRNYERLQRLYEVSNVIHSSLDPLTALQHIVQESVRLMNASSGSVALINPTTGFLEIEAAENLPPKAGLLRLKVGEGITGWVGRTGKPARVGDVRRDRRYVMVRDNVRSELAVPLLVDGEVRGVINVDSDRADAFTEDDQRLLEELALQASRVVSNTWIYEQIRLKAQLFESLVSVGQTINSTLNLDDALRVITYETTKLMGAKMCSLMLLDASRKWLDLRASYGAGEVYTTKPRLNIEESLLGIVVRRRKPVQVENVQTSARYQNVDVAREEGLVSLLSVPLNFGGQAIGTLSVYTDAPRQFSNEEVRILSALAELSAVAIEKARLYERVVDVEEQMRQSEKLSALGLLAAEVAHEIRNPLTVMKMLYHSLNLQFPDGDPRNRDAVIISSKMDHLNKIVEQTLDFARNAEPRPAPVNVNQIIDDLGLLTRHKLRNQSIELVRDLQPDLPSVMADTTQLEQAFLNLTLNAAEAMPEGGKLTISSKFLPPARGATRGHVLVEFTDTGEGMTEEQQRTAFASLFNSTKPQGTGLGMAIVGKIVEAHGGELGVKSKRGKGTTISLRLPA